MRRIQVQLAVLLTLVALLAGALALVASTASAQHPGSAVAQTKPPPPATGWDTTTDNGSYPPGKAPSLPAMPIGTPCAVSSTVSGSLAAGDPTMPNRLNRNGTQATCATPKAFPGVIAVNNYYDTYTFTNNSGASQCVTASLEALTCNAMLSVYLNSFDPNNLAT